MNKAEFLYALKTGLADYPEADVQQYTDYYNEMIDDRIEEGLTEEEAVADMGTPEEAVSQIKNENPLPNAFKEKHKLKTWHIVLIVAGSPVWFPILIGLMSGAFSFVAGCFAGLVGLYAVAVALGACALGGFCGIVLMALSGNIPAAVMFAGMGLICAGLSILSFMGLNKLTKWCISLIKKLIAWVRSKLKRKENAQ